RWDIKPGALVVDPFVGAGTTLFVARQHGFSGIGIDISPLSVFITNTKIENYNSDSVREALSSTETALSQRKKVDINRTERLKRAFTDSEFQILIRLRQEALTQPQPIRNLLLLALLRTQQQFSRAVPDGGWFRWIKRSSSSAGILPTFK